MAGDHVRMDHDLPTKAEVLSIRAATGNEVGAVLGRLFLYWRLFDRQTTDGFLPACGYKAIACECGGDEAFWRAVEEVGWLEVSEDGARVPKFDERFGASARRRLLDATRKAKSRTTNSTATKPNAKRTRCGHDADKERTPGGPQLSVSVSVSKHQLVGVFQLEGPDGKLRQLTADDLRNTALVLEWFKLVCRRKILTGSEADLLNVIAATERALELGKNPGAMFVRLVSKREWKNISAAQEDRARARLNQHRNANGCSPYAAGALPKVEDRK